MVLSACGCNQDSARRPITVVRTGNRDMFQKRKASVFVGLTIVFKEALINVQFPRANYVVGHNSKKGFC